MPALMYPTVGQYNSLTLHSSHLWTVNIDE